MTDTKDFTNVTKIILETLTQIKMENKIKEILNQIQSDLSDLQNNPDGLSYEQLEKFYDRVCSSITEYESAEKQKRDFNKYFNAYMKQQIKNDFERSLGLSF